MLKVDVIIGCHAENRNLDGTWRGKFWSSNCYDGIAGNNQGHVCFYGCEDGGDRGNWRVWRDTDSSARRARQWFLGF